MTQTMCDYASTQAPFDSDLAALTRELDLRWRSWQQVEDPDEDYEVRWRTY